MMNSEEVKKLIDKENVYAWEILHDKLGGNPAAKFKRLTKGLFDLIEEVQKEFPDACYYTASGELNLLIGTDHDFHGCPQQDMVAHSVECRLVIGDGDW